MFEVFRVTVAFIEMSRQWIGCIAGEGNEVHENYYTLLKKVGMGACFYSNKYSAHSAI